MNLSYMCLIGLGITLLMIIGDAVCENAMLAVAHSILFLSFSIMTVALRHE